MSACSEDIKSVFPKMISYHFKQNKRTNIAANVNKAILLMKLTDFEESAQKFLCTKNKSN